MMDSHWRRRVQMTVMKVQVGRRRVGGEGGREGRWNRREGGGGREGRERKGREVGGCGMEERGGEREEGGAMRRGM